MPTYFLYIIAIQSFICSCVFKSICPGLVTNLRSVFFAFQTSRCRSCFGTVLGGTVNGISAVKKAYYRYDIGRVICRSS